MMSRYHEPEPPIHVRIYVQPIGYVYWLYALVFVKSER
jgi:hypothetical protein